MRPANKTLGLAVLAFGSVLATAAFAQNYPNSRQMNDGGFVDYGASNPGAPSGQSDQAGTNLYGAPPATTQNSAQPYPMADQYNGQQRSQRTGSAANTQHWEARDAALGGGGPYYNFFPFAGGPNSEATAPCQARFHSFDPATGTYLGFDGRRHACP